MLYSSIKLFETLGVIRIKHGLTKSNIFLDDESGDFDNKILLLTEKANVTQKGNATQKGNVVIKNNNVFKENNNEKSNNVSTTCTA